MQPVTCVHKTRTFSTCSKGASEMAQLPARSAKGVGATSGRMPPRWNPAMSTVDRLCEDDVNGAGDALEEWRAEDAAGAGLGPTRARVTAVTPMAESVA